MTGILRNQDFDYEYYVYGSGSKILFAFHGFGNHATHFHPIEKELGKEYTIVSVNLFFHGKSQVTEKLVEDGVSIKLFKEIQEKLFTLFPAEKYDLMGFSLGGRIALKLTELFPEKIRKLILLAPDGLVISTFYRFSTNNFTGRKLFKSMTKNPDTVNRIAALLKRFRIVDEKRYQVAQWHFESREKRERVYNVWMTYRHILPHLGKLRKLIRENAIQVELYFGKYDKIIPIEVSKKLSSGMDETVKTIILDAGHQLMRDSILHEIGRKIRQ